MAKIIRYEFRPVGTKELICPTKSDFETNLPIAQEEAYNGEYTVEGEFDPVPAPAPTLEDRVDTLEVDTADLAEALNMILEGVVE